MATAPKYPIQPDTSEQLMLVETLATLSRIGSHCLASDYCLAWVSNSNSISALVLLRVLMPFDLAYLRKARQFREW